MSYAKRFHTVFKTGNIAQLNTVPSTTRIEVTKGLIVVSKYIGQHEQFKALLKSYGIKPSKPDALAAFVRIYGNYNSNLDQ